MDIILSFYIAEINIVIGCEKCEEEGHADLVQSEEGRISGKGSQRGQPLLDGCGLGTNPGPLDVTRMDRAASLSLNP